MHYIWDLVFYTPIYNGLVFLINIVPWHDVVVAVILLTVIVRLIMSPLSRKAIQSQLVIKSIQPELDKIKKEITDKQEQAKRTLALYKEKKINPFSSFFFLLIQIPIIFALYFVFLDGLTGETEILYSFIQYPEYMSKLFLGFLDIESKKNIIIAVLAGLSQYFQFKYSAASKQAVPAPGDDDKSFQAQFGKSMNMQMKYFLPALIAFFAYNMAVAIGLYWITSNLFTMGQEIYLQNKRKNEKLN